MVVLVSSVSSVRELVLKWIILDFSGANEHVVLTTYVLNATSIFQLASDNANNFSHCMITMKDKQQQPEAMLL